VAAPERMNAGMGSRGFLPTVEPNSQRPRRPLPEGDSSAPAGPLSRPWLFVLWMVVGVVLVAGLTLPDLPWGDAPLYAVIALRMFVEHDWVNLIATGTGDFLDKPHLLFWSAIAGYHLFGVHDWSYRLASVLVSLLGAFSTGRLAGRLHGPRAGQMAGLVFITAQTILLGNWDVRTDALLTGFTAFATWQLVRWLDEGSIASLVAGAVGLGLAVSSKGMVAGVACVPGLLLYAWGRGQLARIASPRVLVGLAAFFFALGPVLFAYYLQFDLHPEKHVFGSTGVSGVRFILFDQSFRRFGGGEGDVLADDSLFFFHTLLWAFLPWSLLLYAAWGRRLVALFRAGWGGFRAADQLSFLWPLLFVALLGFSHFKLPHYINVIIPMLSVLVAGELDLLARSGRPATLRVLARLQWALIAALLLAGVVLNGWAFPLRLFWVGAGVAVLGFLLAASSRLVDPVQRIWVPSAVAGLLFNFALNASFIPQLGGYQPGAAFARRVLALDVDWDRCFFLDRLYRPFQLYTGREIQPVDLPRVEKELLAGHRVFLLVGDEGKAQLVNAGLQFQELLSSPDCRISMPTLDLMMPSRRDHACARAYFLVVGAPREPS
jgi:4-amino-4-deoxy-L-arabinose transferase-like glycosyltransferase